MLYLGPLTVTLICVHGRMVSVTLPEQSNTGITTESRQERFDT